MLLPPATSFPCRFVKECPTAAFRNTTYIGQYPAHLHYFFYNTHICCLYINAQKNSGPVGRALPHTAVTLRKIDRPSNPTCGTGQENIQGLGHNTLNDKDLAITPLGG